MLHPKTELPFTLEVVSMHPIEGKFLSIPEKVVPGAQVFISVGFRCKEGCDLTGKKVQVVGPPGIETVEATLFAFDEYIAYHQAIFDFQAPASHGKWNFKVIFPEQDF